MEKKEEKNHIRLRAAAHGGWCNIITRGLIGSWENFIAASVFITKTIEDNRSQGVAGTAINEKEMFTNLAPIIWKM